MTVEFTHTWKTIDKTDWPRGEWDNEPDKVQWIDKATGFDCLIVRVPHHGALCGYVGIPPTLSLFEKEYGDERIDRLDCHGGVTFSDRCEPVQDESHGICHTGAVANDTVWWIGFDCNHGFDKAPAMHNMPHNELLEKMYSPKYKNIEYVKESIEVLALQLITEDI